MMARTTTLRAGNDAGTVWTRGATRAQRLRREATTMVLLCAGLTLLVLGLYLVAPRDLRDEILGNFLGFDRPAVSVAGHPPLSL